MKQRESCIATSQEHHGLTAIRNRCLMRLLERIARKFNEAGVPILVLKGAALQLTLYRSPHERPMTDLDIQVHPEDSERAQELLNDLGCARTAPLVREDFFPRFHYEIEYITSGPLLMKIDLHVRPFRPARYARLLPAGALWDGAEPLTIGGARILVPSAHEMLIHLLVHVAVHGYCDAKWLVDIRRWTDARRDSMDWAAFVKTVDAWRMAHPVRAALARAKQDGVEVCPPEIITSLHKLRVNWRDRLALWQAPRDAAHPVMHTVVNALTTPGLGYMLGYIISVLLPGREHMSEWYTRRHFGWLPLAHLLRWTWPVTKYFGRLWKTFLVYEVRSTRRKRLGLFALRDIDAGQVIAGGSGRSFLLKKVDPDDALAAAANSRGGVPLRGKLKFLNESCGPNASLSAAGLVASRRISAGSEITIPHQAIAEGDAERTIQTRPVRSLSEAA